MGVILAKFRKEKTTVEILENLETKIKDIESYTISTQERQKRFVGNFLVVSIGLYVISSIIFFFAFFPPTWQSRIIYSSPLLFFPILIIFVKRLVAYYFQRKLNRNANQLKTLRTEKKKIIEQVMDKETYKVALDILNRFADPATRLQHQPVPINNALRSPTVSANQSIVATPKKTDPKQIGTTTPYGAPRPMPMPRTPINARGMPSPAPSPAYRSVPQYAQGSPMMANRMLQQRPLQMTPYPIVNQNQKGVFEKVVDYLIGEGPSSRYAMICKECHGHNGMVSQEDYEYSAFKCAFCKTLNQARKLRPVAPRLPVPPKIDDQSVLQRSVTTARHEEPSSSSASEKDSSLDSEPISHDETKELKSDAPVPKVTTEQVDPEPTIEFKSVPATEPERDAEADAATHENGGQNEETTAAPEDITDVPKDEIDKKNE